MVENKTPEQRLADFSYISSIVELNKTATDLIFALEKVKKLKEDLARRCAQIGISFRITDDDFIVWRGEKDLPQKL
jgi:hypothetical protein